VRRAPARSLSARPAGTSELHGADDARAIAERAHDSEHSERDRADLVVEQRRRKVVTRGGQRR
jgi:hypothetical protein